MPLDSADHEQYRIIDTNVPVIADGNRSPQASPECRLACVSQLKALLSGKHQIVIDDSWHILKEYKANLYRSSGLGREFLQRVLQNRNNPSACVQVHLEVNDDGSFKDFPEDDALKSFDLEDRKWIALSRASQRQLGRIVPIVQAADLKWLNFVSILSKYGVTINFICNTILSKKRRRVQRRH